MKQLNDYIDKNGMICTSPTNGLDGGDSCAYGFAIFYSAIIAHQIPNIGSGVVYAKKLEQQPGRYCRNPDLTKWYSQTSTFSRDQLIPLICYLGIAGYTDFLIRLFIAHLKRGLLFAWNTTQDNQWVDKPGYTWKFPDLTGPDIWALWIRAFNAWYLYPLLIILDLYTLIGMLFYRLSLIQTTLQMNCILEIDFSNQKLMTPISWLTKKIYGKSMPIAALEETFGPEMNPPVNQFMVPMVEKW